MKYIPYSKIFNNLKTMELGRLNLKDSNLVAFFLRCSPHLQMLTLNLAEVLSLYLSIALSNH